MNVVVDITSRREPESSRAAAVAGMIDTTADLLAKMNAARLTDTEFVRLMAAYQRLVRSWWDLHDRVMSER